MASSYIRVGNTLTNILDSETGENISFDKVTLWRDGTPMDDSKCDKGIYRKLVTLEHGIEYFKRNYSGAINAKWFGAVGDGTTDDTVAIQAALDALPENGGDLLLPESRTPYIITGGVNVRSKSSINIIGYGATLKSADNSKTHILTFSGDKSLHTDFANTGFLSRSFKISGLTFDGNADNALPPGPGEGDGWNALRIIYLQDLVVENCSFKNTYNKSLIIDVAHGVTIRDTYFDGDLEADSIYTYCAPVGSVYPGVLPDKDIKTRNIMIQRCTFNNVPRAFVFTDGFTDGVIIDSCFFATKAQIFENMRAFMCRTNASNIVFSNNIMLQGGGLCYIRGMNRNITVKNNTVMRSKLQPIIISGLIATDFNSPSWGPVFESDNIILDNNSFTDGNEGLPDSTGGLIHITTFDGIAGDGDTYQVGVNNITIKNTLTGTTKSIPDDKNDYSVYAVGKSTAKIKGLRIYNNVFQKNDVHNILAEYVDLLDVVDNTLSESKDNNMVIRNSTSVKVKSLRLSGAGSFSGPINRNGITLDTVTSGSVDDIFGSDTASMNYILSASGTDIFVNNISCDLVNTSNIFFDNGITFRKVFSEYNNSSGLQFGQLIKRLPIYNKATGAIEGYTPMFSTILTAAQTNIAGLNVDMNLTRMYKDIGVDTTLTLINGADGNHADIIVRNTSVVGARTISITGVAFQNGSSNSIPIGGKAHITIDQLNGVVDARIFIYG